jgi:hypothetical protein
MPQIRQTSNTHPDSILPLQGNEKNEIEESLRVMHQLDPTEGNDSKYLNYM